MKKIAAFMLYIAIFIIGFSVGLSVNVFMVRGTPVTSGGGELLLLLALPASAFVGFRAGVKHITRRRSRYEPSIEHTD